MDKSLTPKKLANSLVVSISKNLNIRIKAVISSPCPRRTIPVIINMTIAAILQTVNTICIREAHFTLAQFTNRITAAMKRSKNLSRLKQRLVFYNLYCFHSSNWLKREQSDRKKLCGYLYFPAGGGFGGQCLACVAGVRKGRGKE